MKKSDLLRQLDNIIFTAEKFPTEAWRCKLLAKIILNQLNPKPEKRIVPSPPPRYDEVFLEGEKDLVENG